MTQHDYYMLAGNDVLSNYKQSREAPAISKHPEPDPALQGEPNISITYSVLWDGYLTGSPSLPAIRSLCFAPPPPPSPPTHPRSPITENLIPNFEIRHPAERREEKKMQNVSTMDIPDFVQLGGARRAKKAGGRRTTRGSSSESSASSSVSSSPANSPRGPPQHLAHSYVAARQGRIRPQQLCCCCCCRIC